MYFRSLISQIYVPLFLPDYPKKIIVKMYNTPQHIHPGFSGTYILNQDEVNDSTQLSNCQLLLMLKS